MQSLNCTKGWGWIPREGGDSKSFAGSYAAEEVILSGELKK
jgi:hypothetical protein